MSKNRPTSPTSRDSAGGQTRQGLGVPLWLRAGVTVVLVWHILAIFMAAMSVPGSSRLAEYIAQNTFMQNYLDALHLNQGHAFFAPNPPVMVTIEYEIRDERGAPIARGSFPNLKEQSPRLFYHRYFMLADQAGPGAPADLPTRQKQLYEKWLTGYARQLLQNSGGATIRAQRQLQELVSPEEFLAGKALNKGAYHVTADVTQTRRDLAAENAPPVSRRDAAGWSAGGRR